MNKEKLLKQIIKYYGNEVSKENNIDDTLKGCLHVMKETNQNCFKTGDVESLYNTWTKEEIEFIESL